MEFLEWPRRWHPAVIGPGLRPPLHQGQSTLSPSLTSSDSYRGGEEKGRRLTSAQGSLAKKRGISVLLLTSPDCSLRVSSSLSRDSDGREGSGCPGPTFPPAGHETWAERYLVVTGQMAAFRRLVEAGGHLLQAARPRPHAGAAGSGRRAVERRYHGLESRTPGGGPGQQGRGVEG